jgi:hypothetical protein
MSVPLAPKSHLQLLGDHSQSKKISSGHPRLAFPFGSRYQQSSRVYQIHIIILIS